jgi:hypothetical protein
VARANIADILGQITTSATFGFKFGGSTDTPGPRGWYGHIGLGLNVLVTLMVLGLGIGLIRQRALWGMWVVATLAMMILVLPHERYCLQMLPLLVFGWWQGLRWINHRLPIHAGNLVFGGLLVLGFVPNVLQVGGIVIEQRRTPFLTYYHDGKYADVFAVAGRIRSSSVPADAVILAPDKSARIISYLSKHTVVERNDLVRYIAWPEWSRPIYVVDDPEDADFQAWLKELGVGPTEPVGSATGRLQLRSVTRK